MLKSLYSAVIGDIMDQAGLLHQFLPPQIGPLRSDMVVVGRAMPVLGQDLSIEELEEDKSEDNPRLFGLMLEALDDLKPNEVYIQTGSSPQYALWGELMSTRAIKLGAAGAVVNGYSRDTKGVLALDFPTFSYGHFAQDIAPRGKVIDYRSKIEIGQVTINNGDIVFGDLDGVCVIPREMEEEIIQGALEKALGEKTVQKAIESGMSSRAAFDKYGIM